MSSSLYQRETMGHIRSRVRLGFLSCSLLAMLTAAACSIGGPTSGEAPAGGDGALGVGRAPLTQPLNCGGTRWIAIMNSPAAVCDFYAPSSSSSSPSGWSSEPLFKPTAGTLPDDLNRYCLVTWTASTPPIMPSPPSVEIDSLVGNPDLTNVTEDCSVILPQSTSGLGLEERLAYEHRGWIHAAAGGLSHLPQPITSLRPTRLAIVDNAPESLGPNPGSATLNPLPPILAQAPSTPFGEHGEVMAYIGRDLGCPEGETSSFRCAVHAETVLAMRDGNPNPQPNAGGLFGTRSELARAILRAVEDWKKDVLSGEKAEPRLVINLSLGWEEHSADTKSSSSKDCNVARSNELDSPSQAVYDAIVYARCHGALVLAASGNETGGPAPLRHEGLTCPARFMVWDAPDDDYCAKGPLSGTPSFDAIYRERTELDLRPSVIAGAYDPLVYPIGGVDFGDVPLAPHRPQSLPQLVAPAHLGSSYENDSTTVAAATILPLQAPSSLSGTSVSTAIASAIAATAWAYSPDLAPADVMDLLHRTGTNLRGFPAVEATRPQGVAPGSAIVRRASLCQTLLGLSLLPAADECGNTKPKGENDPQSPPMSEDTRRLFTAYYETAHQIPVTVAPVALSDTPLGKHFTRATALDVTPSPPLPTCTRCGFKPSHSAAPVILYLDAAQQLFEFFLVVDDVAYGDASGTGLIVPSTSAGTAVEITGLPTSVDANSRAFLEWKDISGYADYTQLQIIH
jgi:Subtilase family